MNLLDELYFRLQYNPLAMLFDELRRRWTTARDTPPEPVGPHEYETELSVTVWVKVRHTCDAADVDREQFRLGEEFQDLLQSEVSKIYPEAEYGGSERTTLID